MLAIPGITLGTQEGHTLADLVAPADFMVTVISSGRARRVHIMIK